MKNLSAPPIELKVFVGLLLLAAAIMALLHG